MHVNSTKSNIMHFRANSVMRTSFNFTCGSSPLNLVDRYTYLGVVLHEQLDFNITVKAVAQSASRALGLLIAKCKSIGGLPFDVYTKLYDSLVWPVISYSAPLWGYKPYSCIEAIHNRAQRFFLGVGKYTPNDGLAGETGWTPPIVRQWKSIALYWSKLSCMNRSRFNKRIAMWSDNLSKRTCRNWCFYVKSFFSTNDFDAYCSLTNPIARSFAILIEDKTFADFTKNWLTRINQEVGPSGHGRNKLRLYKIIKTDFTTEQYCNMILPLRHRSAFSKFRLGVAPIRIETGRYEGLREENRICPFCANNIVENELHVILNCEIYKDIRESLFNKALSQNPEFRNMPDCDKFSFLFSNFNLIRICAKTCFLILQRRQFLLCK